MTFSFISQVQFLNSLLIDHSSKFLRERSHFQEKKLDSFITRVFGKVTTKQWLLLKKLQKAKIITKEIDMQYLIYGTWMEV